MVNRNKKTAKSVNAVLAKSKLHVIYIQILALLAALQPDLTGAIMIQL